LKPFTFQRFLQAVDKVKSNLSRKEISTDQTFIFVKTEFRLEKIMLNDVLYIEGMRDYRRIHTLSKKIMTLQTFKEFEREISSGLICRVHKSFMVAINKIDLIEKDAIKINSKWIPISETYKKSFFEKINHKK
jgi:DNA-binding LytR/AlgR family response regulator